MGDGKEEQEKENGPGRGWAKENGSGALLFYTETFLKIMVMVMMEEK